MSESITQAERQLVTVETLVHLQPEIAGLQLYEYFRSDAASQKKTFVGGEQVNLNLTYPDLTQANIARLSIPSELALRALMPGETDKKTEALYRAIEYRQGEVCLMSLAACVTDATLEKAVRDESAHWFRETNEALYGIPESDPFNAIVEKHITPLLQDLETDNDYVRGVRTELRSLIGEIDSTDYELALPSDEVIERLGNAVRERFEPIYEHVDPEKTYDVSAIVEALDEALERMGGKELGWHVAIAPNSASLAVSAHQKLVEVGEGRKEIAGNKLRALILHELGVHAGRSMFAEQAGWLSAAYGQDGYLDFEESLATALEDAYLGKAEEKGITHYLNLGLAYGLDNHEPRDFRQVFEVAWRVKYLQNLAVGEVFDETVVSKAKNNAFTACLRIFRGTPTTIPGLTYNKDLAYFKGQELVWPLLEKVECVEDLDVLLCGKLDLTRTEHQAIAEDIMSARAN